MSESGDGPVAVPPATEPQQHVRLDERTGDQSTIGSQSTPTNDDKRSYEAVRRASAAIAEDRRPAAKDRVLLGLNARRVRGAALSIGIAILVRFNWEAGEMRHGGRLKLSKLTGYDIKGVDAAIDELEAKGAIIVRKGLQLPAGNWGQNTYVFPDMVSEGGGVRTPRGGGVGAATPRVRTPPRVGAQTPLGSGGIDATITLERTLDLTLEEHSPPPPRQGRGARERDRKAGQVHLIERLCADRPDLAKVLREFCQPLIAMRRLESSDPAFAVIAIAEHAAQFPARVIAAAKNAILRERTDTFGEVHVSKALDAAVVASGGQRSPDRPAAPYTPAHGLIEIRQSTHPAEWSAWKSHAWHRRHGDTLHGKMERLGVAYVPSLMPPEAATREEAS